MKRFPRTGFLALQPQALFEMYVEEVAPRAVRMVSGFPVVEIVGPLVHHSDAQFDSYDAIHDRVAEACATNTTHVILKIDSPGGDVSGCLDTARELRSMCAAAGKQLVAFVDGQATSASYALACPADLVVVTNTAIVGSIGIIDVRVDTTAIDKAMGMRFAITTSGSRKADGNPHTPITDEELAIRQSKVDALAQEFFALVSETRGLSVAAIAALQAGTLHGSAAVKAGLADRVQSFDEMISALSAGAMEETTMPVKEAIAALRKAAEGDDEDAKQAKKMLAALDAEGEEDKPADEPVAESDAPPSEDEEKKKKDEEEKAKAATAAVSQPAASTSASATEQRLAALEADARATFLATRPDLSAETLAGLQNLPVSQVRAIVGGIPKPPKAAPKANTTVPATRGAGQGGPSADAPTASAQAMAQYMGRTTYGMGVKREGNLQTFGVIEAPAPSASKVG